MTPGVHDLIELVALDCSGELSDRKLQQILQQSNVHVVVGQVWDSVRPAIEQTVALLNRLPRSTPWGSYLIADADSREVVGICGFKDAPSGGSVEIAYYTFPPNEGKGYATAAAAALTQLAESSSEVQTVIAHTLMEPNASTRILTKCGFALAGEVVDPEDGRIWKWQRPVNHRGGRAPTERIHV